MKKTRIILAIAAILGIVVAVTLLLPTPTTLEPGVKESFQSAPSNPEEAAGTVATANQQTRLQTFEDSPLETHLSAIECQRATGLGADAEYKQQQQRTLIAWQLYEQGEPALDLADALAANDFDQGRNFYRFIKLREAILGAESFLSQSESGREVMQTANGVFQLPVTSDVQHNLSALEGKLVDLWRTQFPDIWDRLPSEGDRDTYVSQIRSASVPSEILENRYLSPVLHFYWLSLQIGDLTSAATLLDAFPSLLQSGAVYENQLMYRTLLGLSMEITEALVRTDAFTELWGKLPQSQPVVLSRTSKTPWGEWENRAIKALQEQGFSVHMAYMDSYNITAREDLLNQLNSIGSALDEDTRGRIAQCAQQQAWFDARKFTPEKLAQYRASPLIDKVKYSPEMRHCAERLWSLENELPQQINELVAPMREAMQQTTEWQQYPIAELLAKASSEEEKTQMLLLSNTLLTLLSDTPSQEVGQWLKQQDVQLDRKTLLTMLGQLDSSAWLFWANDVPWTDNEIKAIALAAAQIGELNIYEGITRSHPNIAWHDDELDPLYFAIQSFSTGSITMFGIEINKTKVMNALEQTPGKLKEHHLRALFELRQNSPDAYDKLIGLYPRFTLRQDPEYFAVSCKSPARL